MTVLHEETRLRAMSLASFAEALAEVKPTPAGSSAVALPSIVAAGLVATAARSTVACEPFSDLAFDMDAVACEADELRVELLDLLDEDADAFDRVMAARRLPQATLEQRVARSLEIQRAYEDAVQPPLHVCQRSVRVLELAADVAERGHPHAAADGGVAVLFAAASVEAAALNVETELAPIVSEAFCTACKEELRTLRARAGELASPSVAVRLPRHPREDGR
jgi:formiminotetrahydrofolate cyclodeaminase